MDKAEDLRTFPDVKPDDRLFGIVSSQKVNQIIEELGLPGPGSPDL
jgi:hypothetical protein